MAKRGKKKKPGLGTRAKRQLLRFMVLVVLLGTLAALSVTVLFPIRRCTIEGETRYSAGEFAAAMDLDGQRLNLFRADKAALAKQVHATLPYVHIQKISRRFPNAVQLTVEEYVPIFAQQQDEHWWLIAEDGKLLERVDAAPEGLLTMVGAALDKPKAGSKARWVGSAAGAADLAALLAGLRGSVLWEDITGLRISSSSMPDAIYQGRIRIRFGTELLSAGAQGETLEGKIPTAEAIILGELNAQNPEYRGQLDLSRARGDFTPQWGEWEP